MDALTTYHKILAAHKFTFIVFYRGSWCPFCMSYLRALEALRSSIEASSGTIVAITAQDPSFQDVTRKSSGYQGKIIVDRELSIATELREKGLLDVAVSQKEGYTKGMTQPAILVVGEKGEVLYRWEIVPSTMNLGGAKDRPNLAQVWANIDAKLKGEQVKFATVQTDGFFHVMMGKLWGLFRS